MILSKFNNIADIIVIGFLVHSYFLKNKFSV